MLTWYNPAFLGTRKVPISEDMRLVGLVGMHVSQHRAVFWGRANHRTPEPPASESAPEHTPAPTE